MQEPTPEQAGAGDASTELIEATVDAAPSEGRGQLRKDISNAMVGLKKHLYGKGPTKAKTYINDNIVFCVLEGGLTRNEETLIAAGEEQLVRSYRLRFQEVVGKTSMGAIEELTGCKVLTYHSQIVFGPTRAFEIFLLEPDPGARQRAARVRGAAARSRSAPRGRCDRPRARRGPRTRPRSG